MKANCVAWILLLLLVGGGCDRKPASHSSNGQDGSADGLNVLVKTNSTSGSSEAQPTQSAENLRSRAPAEEVKQIRRAAEQGDAEAEYKLGLAYEEGQGVEKNKDEALKWFGKSANQGLAAAQYKLYRKLYKYGVPEDKSNSEARKWLRKAADQGYAIAQSDLGLRLLFDSEHSGKLPSEAEKLGAEGIRWLHKAADQGYEGAQWQLGNEYESGRVVETNKVEALRWYRKAAEQGSASAQNSVGRIYFFGGAGVRKDVAEAVKWYHKAANQGDWPAQEVLGRLYSEGQGVERDYVEAYAWYNLAAVTARSSVVSGSAKERDILEQKMTPQQVGEAQKRTKELRAAIDLRLK